MNERSDGEGFILSSGREIYAHNGIIGINPKLELYEGFDGDLFPFMEQPADFTNEEAVEIADYMIGTWTRFRQEYE